MRKHSLNAVRTRMDDALAALLLREAVIAPEDVWDAYEMLCIAELDAIHDQFGPQIVQDYMLVLLDLKRLNLGLDLLAPP